MPWSFFVFGAKKPRSICHACYWIALSMSLWRLDESGQYVIHLTTMTCCTSGRVQPNNKPHEGSKTYLSPHCWKGTLRPFWRCFKSNDCLNCQFSFNLHPDTLPTACKIIQLYCVQVWWSKIFAPTLRHYKTSNAIIGTQYNCVPKLHNSQIPPIVWMWPYKTHMHPNISNKITLYWSHTRD